MPLFVEDSVQCPPKLTLDSYSIAKGGMSTPWLDLVNAQEKDMNNYFDVNFELEQCQGN